MKMTLSMPRTISRTVRVSRAIEGFGGQERSKVHGLRIPGRCGRSAYHGATVRDSPVTTRALPVLDVLDAGLSATAPSAPRRPAGPSDARLGEYLPDLASLPRFHIWTLGCQMNRSDSEEMAGRLLAAGCEEAPSMEAADLVVINTCAIREGAEQKVIGRQGHLARLKAANPGLRVVLTGCSVREAERDGLQRRYPAVDAFLRPDEEPELVDRLGLASAQGAIGATGSVGRTTTVGRTVVGAADSLPGTRAAAVGQGTRRPRLHHERLAADHLRLRQDVHLLHRAVQPRARSAAGRSTTSSTRLAQLAAAGYREVTLLGQNVNSYGHDLAPEARFAHVDAERWAGRQLDLHGRPDLAELIRAIDGLRTADGRPAIPRLRFVTSHPWDLSDRLIAALAECPSVCEHLHLPVQSGDDAVLRRMGRQYTIEHYQERLARIREAVPGITISTDVIVGFCGETEAQFEGTLRLLETRALRPGLRRGVLATTRARRPPSCPTTCRRTSSAGASTSCSPSRKASACERNRAWLGREVEVLVDTVVPPKATRTRGHARWRESRRPAGSVQRPHAGQQTRPCRGRQHAPRDTRAGADRPRRAIRLARGRHRRDPRCGLALTGRSGRQYRSASTGHPARAGWDDRRTLR